MRRATASIIALLSFLVEGGQSTERVGSGKRGNSIPCNKYDAHTVVTVHRSWRWAQYVFLWVAILDFLFSPSRLTQYSVFFNLFWELFFWICLLLFTKFATCGCITHSFTYNDSKKRKRHTIELTPTIDTSCSRLTNFKRADHKIITLDILIAAAQ